jgi:predicted nucleic acid-binding protein
MAAEFLYFDTSYIVRLYLQDNEFAKVRELAGSATGISSAWHAQAEIVAAFHRAFRERRLNQTAYDTVLGQFRSEAADGFYRWLPLTDSVQQRLEQFFQKASSSTFLRAADALHLACAAEHGFTQVYSNDRHFLAAAPLFGLEGVNIISPPTS